MLSKIFIQNFALIDRLEIELKPGLQVITGETGAGKSIILGALRLILGERADAKAIQNSDNKSIVETEFSVAETFRNFFEENDLDFENPTLIRREILPSGKSRAFVNDVPVTLDVLRELSTKLVDIHSQFETSNLFTEEYQFKIIDGLSENRKILPEYQKEFSEYKSLQRLLQQQKKQLAEGNKEADYNLFLLTELEEAELDSVNLEDLQSQLALQENAGSISENLAQIIARFDQEDVGVLDHFTEIRSRLSKSAELSHHFSELNERFETQFLEFKDFVFELQNEAEKIETDPLVLQELSTKINKINALLVKHNAADVEELMAIRDKISSEQSSFADLENSISQTEKKLSGQQEILEKFAKKLSGNRAEASKILKAKTEALLKQIGLEKAKIEVELTPAEEFNVFGKEKIAVLFQANSGFALKPIQSAISGGERSRVMLAVKKIMAENSELPTLILDEIDTGVSGKVADEMGKVMQEMAKDMQLIVISHLAQVAAKGSDNYKVVKRDVDGKTQSTIIPLTKEEKLTEIAQLLSGSKITEAAIKQAEELVGNK